MSRVSADGNDRVQRGLRGGAVVGMVDVPIAVEHSLRVADDDCLGFVFADEPRQFFAKRESRFQFAIRIAEEDRLFHAENFVCGASVPSRAVSPAWVCMLRRVRACSSLRPRW